MAIHLFEILQAFCSDDRSGQARPDHHTSCIPNATTLVVGITLDIRDTRDDKDQIEGPGDNDTWYGTTYTRKDRLGSGQFTYLQTALRLLSHGWVTLWDRRACRPPTT
ncbi:hypothetical protein ACRALDRAFT_2031411 [Sodiomyces alcalophilus JCM 7366]|uniref:uncharacterized protein n=1 Tax=Sodiomyces alcalophilus JCM 7366 TaxID=591952 RepID=UPI0039B57C5B